MVLGWWLSLGSAPSIAPACGGQLDRFGLKQAHTNHSTLDVEALDHLPTEFEFADHDGGEVDSGGAQLVKRDGLLG